MFSLGLKRILQETFHLQWENHGKCPCVSADFPEISWNNPKTLLLKNRTSGIYVCVLHMIYNYTFIYFKPYMYIYIYIIMYCRPTVKLELLAPSYLTNWSNMAVPRRHVLRHPRWLPSGQRRPAVRGAVRGPSSAITAIRCINMYMYTCMWITVYTIYTFMHIYIYISIYVHIIYIYNIYNYIYRERERQRCVCVCTSYLCEYLYVYSYTRNWQNFATHVELMGPVPHEQVFAHMSIYMFIHQPIG